MTRLTDIPPEVRHLVAEEPMTPKVPLLGDDDIPEVRRRWWRDLELAIAHIDVPIDELVDQATELVARAQQEAGLDGLDRRRKVRRELAAWLDARVTWSKTPTGALLEAVDRPIFAFLVDAVVEAAYRAWKRARERQS